MSDEAAAKSWCGPFRATEMEKAKYVAQVFTRHSGLGLESFFCELYFPTFGMLDLSLLRRSFDADPVSPLQPQAGYYVTRNLATMMDGLEPAAFECAVDPVPPNLELFTFAGPEGRAIALWRGGHAKDRCEPVAVNVRLPACRTAAAFDPVNGVKQELVVAAREGGAELKGLLIGDAPLIVRLAAP